MTEETKQLDSEQTVTSEPAKEEAPSINAQAKELPWVQDLMRKSKEADELKVAQEQARKEAEIKELEAQGKHEEIIKAREAELESLKEQHANELKQRDLKTELLKAGFDNDLFMAGAVTNYGDESGSIADYVKALAEDEANAVFLGKTNGRDPKPAPGLAPQLNSSSLTGQQIKAMKKSENPEERAKAFTALRNYIDTHDGEFPPGYN